MSAKVHIVDSVEPLVLFDDCYSRCGTLLTNPRPVFMWDLQEMGEPMNVSGCCRACMKALDPQLKYVYGVRA